MGYNIIENNKDTRIRRKLRLLAENSFYGIDPEVAFRNIGLGYIRHERKENKQSDKSIRKNLSYEIISSGPSRNLREYNYEDNIRGDVLSEIIYCNDDYVEYNKHESYLYSILQMLVYGYCPYGRQYGKSSHILSLTHDLFQIYNYKYDFKKEAVKRFLYVEDCFRELPNAYTEGLILFEDYDLSYKTKLKKLVSTIFKLCRKHSYLDLIHSFGNKVMIRFFENFIMYARNYVTGYNDYILIFELLIMMKSITISDFMSSDVFMDAYISAFLYVNNMKPCVSKKEQVKLEPKFKKSAKYISEDIIDNGIDIRYPLTKYAGGPRR